MAPGDYDLFADAGYAKLQTPVMHMTGELDSAPNESIWSALAGLGHYRTHILGGGHQTFTDFSGILEQKEGLIDAESGHRIVRIFALAYAEFLMGEADRLTVLDGSLVVSDQVVLSQ